jgi:hypothetical protein
MGRDGLSDPTDKTRVRLLSRKKHMGTEREREQANKVRGAKQIWEVPTGGTSPKILEV